MDLLGAVLSGNSIVYVYQYVVWLSERKACRQIFDVIKYVLRVTVLQGALTSFLNGMGVVLVNHFDFKDLMTFGLFLLALLTFIFTFCK